MRRPEPMECGKHRGIIAGQAFTRYRCQECRGQFLWPNTAIPKLCYVCARETGKCARCLEQMAAPTGITSLRSAIDSRLPFREEDVRSAIEHSESLRVSLYEAMCGWDESEAERIELYRIIAQSWDERFAELSRDQLVEVKEALGRAFKERERQGG